MKFSRKLVAMTLALVMVCMWGATCFAFMDSGVSPMYDYVQRITTALNISSKVATCTGIMSASSSDTKTKITMTLQCKEDGTTRWLPVKSWSASASGAHAATLSKTQSVARGYDYRVYVRGMVSDSEGVVLETASMYSRIVDY